MTSDSMGYTSLTIGIIILCIVSGLALMVLCIFLLIKWQRTSNILVENEKQQDEMSDWWPWSLTPPPLAVTTTNSINHPDNKAHKTKLAALLSSMKSKKVPTAAAATTMLDDIPLPPLLTATPTSSRLSPPARATTTYSSRWKQENEIERRSPIVFEEGYDPRALLRLPYYHHSNQHHGVHPPSHHHHQPVQQYLHQPLPSAMTANAPLPPLAKNNGSFSSVDDPCLLESLERQKHINDMYCRTTSTTAVVTSATTSTSTFHCHHRSSPSWGSSTIIQSPCIHNKCTNNNSSLLSLSMAEKLEQDAELQRLSMSSYHVW